MLIPTMMLHMVILQTSSHVRFDCTMIGAEKSLPCVRVLCCDSVLGKYNNMHCMLPNRAHNTQISPAEQKQKQTDSLPQCGDDTYKQTSKVTNHSSGKHHKCLQEAHLLAVQGGTSSPECQLLQQLPGQPCSAPPQAPSPHQCPHWPSPYSQPMLKIWPTHTAKQHKLGREGCRQAVCCLPPWLL